MAPELLEDPMAGTAAANVYSFAMIMYNLATRQVLVRSPSDLSPRISIRFKNAVISQINLPPTSFVASAR